MPYKLSGNRVMVERGGKWVLLKAHPSRKKALAHLRALYANVPEAREEAGRRPATKAERKGK